MKLNTYFKTLPQMTELVNSIKYVQWKKTLIKQKTLPRNRGEYYPLNLCLELKKKKNTN